MSGGLLPAGFDELEPFVAEWALTSEYDRRAKRVEAPMEDHRVFYRAVMDQWDDIGAHLKALPPFDLDPASERLLHIAMTAMESGIAVTVFKANDSPLAADFRRLVYLHEA